MYATRPRCDYVSGLAEWEHLRLNGIPGYASFDFGHLLRWSFPPFMHIILPFTSPWIKLNSHRGYYEHFITGSTPTTHHCHLLFCLFRTRGTLAKIEHQ